LEDAATSPVGFDQITEASAGRCWPVFGELQVGRHCGRSRTVLVSK
jgi:hypothetical protein